MTAFTSAVLNSYGRFAVPAVTPIFLNIALISCAFLLSPYLETPILALAWGVLIAGVLQLLFQLPFLAQAGFLVWPRVDWHHEGVKRILVLMGPAIFGVSVSQINLLLDTVLASFLETGSVSWLYYSDRLVELPLGVFGIAIATVILPSLSRRYSSDDQQGFEATMDWSIRAVLLVGLPAATALFVLAEPLLTVLFQYGAFGAQDVAMASKSLRAYAVGLLAFMLIKVLAPGYFSRQDTKTPVKIGIQAMVANMILNLILVFPLAHAGLALATSLAAFLNAGLLYLGLRRLGVYRLQTSTWVWLLKYMVANVMMVLVLLGLNSDTTIWLAWSSLYRVMHILLLVVAGAGTYFLSLWLLGMRGRDLHIEPRHIKP